MSLGKSLIGAVLGAGAGLGAQIGIEQLSSQEAWWFPVVTGLLTGLGVRTLDPSVQTGASYLRGALAAVLGLGGIFGGIYASSQLQVSNMAEVAKPVMGAATDAALPKPDAPAEDEAGAEAESEDSEDQPAATPPPSATNLANEVKAGSGDPIVAPDGFPVWNFVMIGLGMFLAYELARGSNPADGVEAEGSDNAGDAPEAADTPAESTEEQPAGA